jgi:hypothetical protein
MWGDGEFWLNLKKVKGQKSKGKGLVDGWKV